MNKLKFEREGDAWTVTAESQRGTSSFTGRDLWQTYQLARSYITAPYEVYVGSGFTEAVQAFKRAHAEMGHVLRTLAARIDAAKEEEGFDDELIAFITGDKTLEWFTKLLDSGVWEIEGSGRESE